MGNYNKINLKILHISKFISNLYKLLSILKHYNILVNILYFYRKYFQHFIIINES